MHDCAGPCDWYSGTAQPLLYDLIHPPDSDYIFPQLSRFEVVLDGFGHAQLFDLATLEMPNAPVFEPYRFSQGALTTWWYNGTHIQAHISSAKGLPLAGTVRDILLFAVDVDMWGNISSFCPSSGRLVCLDHKQDVYVVDFLTPRPRQNHSSQTSLWYTPEILYSDICSLLQYLWRLFLNIPLTALKRNRYGAPGQNLDLFKYLNLLRVTSPLRHW